MNRITRIPFMLLLAALLALTVFTAVSANEGEQLQEEIEGYEEEREETLREQEEREAELEEVQGEMSEVETELRRLDEEMATTNRQIEAKEEEIDLTMDRVADLEEEIRILEERIADRDELLKERVRQMYQNGGSINYIEVILGAQNFGDLIERISALNSIAQQDQNILQEHIEDMESVELAKENLERELMFLEEQLGELESLRSSLEAQSSEKDQYLEELSYLGYTLEEELISLEEKEELLIAQQQAAKQELEEWERAEEERNAGKKKSADGRRKRSEELLKKRLNGLQLKRPPSRRRHRVPLRVHPRKLLPMEAVLPGTVRRLSPAGRFTGRLTGGSPRTSACGPIRFTAGSVFMPGRISAVTAA